MNTSYMKRYAVCLVTSCCIACTTNTTDEKMIVDRRMAFNNAIADRDTSKIAVYCAEDIMVITSRNYRFIGKDQYAAGLVQEFESKDDLVYLRTPESIKVFPTWEMAAESGLWVGKWKNGNETIDVEGTYYAKWRKKNGQWLITAEIFTLLKCTGGIYCTDIPK